MPEGIRELRDQRRAQQILKDHPDDTVAAEMVRSDSAFWEVGNMSGLVYATNIIVGVRLTANIWIWDKQWMGKTEIYRQMLRYVFKVFDVYRIQATCVYDNALSRVLMKRVGFTEESRLKNYGFHKKVMKDARMFRLLRGDI